VAQHEHGSPIRRRDRRCRNVVVRQKSTKTHTLPRSGAIRDQQKCNMDRTRLLNGSLPIQKRGVTPAHIRPIDVKRPSRHSPPGRKPRRRQAENAVTKDADMNQRRPYTNMSYTLSLKRPNVTGDQNGGKGNFSRSLGDMCSVQEQRIWSGLNRPNPAGADTVFLTSRTSPYHRCRMFIIRSGIE
jgi:hypothetical protein